MTTFSIDAWLTLYGVILSPAADQALRAGFNGESLPVVHKSTTKIALSTARGTRLSPDFLMPAEWGREALRLRPEMSVDQIKLEADKFRDYWCPKTGRDACKLDWLATWRNWMRNAKATPAARNQTRDESRTSAARAFMPPATRTQDARTIDITPAPAAQVRRDDLPSHAGPLRLEMD